MLLRVHSEHLAAASFGKLPFDLFNQVSLFRRRDRAQKIARKASGSALIARLRLMEGERIPFWFDLEDARENLRHVFSAGTQYLKTYKRRCDLDEGSLADFQSEKWKLTKRGSLVEPDNL